MDEREEKLLTSALPEFDAATALARFRDRAASGRIAPAPRAMIGIARVLTLPWARPLAAAMGALAIVAALGLTGVADTILTVFEPQRIVTVQVDPRQLNGIPSLGEYGTLTWIAQPSIRPVADAKAAAAVAGFTPLAPAALPASIPAGSRVAAIPQAKATFAFDEAKARAAAAKTGASLPPMPSAIASTTLTLTGGPAIVQQFGSAPGGTTHDAPLAYNDPRAGLGAPQLILVQSRVPVVTSNGATVQELRDYAVAQPGVPPALAAQILAIGDPVRTLMLPVGIDVGTAKAVSVRGTQGYLVGDGTGLGSGVVWVENGYVLGVMGTLSSSDLLALVNGLR
jgi:hypothetical protein